MVKQTKSQRLREKMQTDIKYSKQTTLGSLPETRNDVPSKTVVPELKKQIEITQITTSTREDELVLKGAFKLSPSRTAFSRIRSDLYFDELEIDSLRLRILQGPLATDESEFSVELDMTGIVEGKHTLRVEMYELWDSGERTTSTSKEATVEYVPVKREDRLIRVPIIKRTEGADLEIVTAMKKNIFREIDEAMKRESEGRREHW
jgi:hypothetical protein